MIPRARLKWVWRVVLLIIVVAALTVGGTAVRVWQVAREDAHPRSDALIVLGASQFDGRPSEIFRARLDHARALYAEHVAPRIVTVGAGQPGDRTTEAAAGARYLAAHGVPAGALLPVPRGTDTLNSLEAAARVFADHRWRTAVIVTDPWHSLRSRRMAHDLGLTAETSPVRSGPVVHSRGTELRYVVRETVAYLFYRAFHRTSVKGPGAA